MNNISIFFRYIPAFSSRTERTTTKRISCISYIYRMFGITSHGGQLSYPMDFGYSLYSYEHTFLFIRCLVQKDTSSRRIESDHIFDCCALSCQVLVTRRVIPAINPHFALVFVSCVKKKSLRERKLYYVRLKRFKMHFCFVSCYKGCDRTLFRLFRIFLWFYMNVTISMNKKILLISLLLEISVLECICKQSGVQISLVAYSFERIKKRDSNSELS